MADPFTWTAIAAVAIGAAGTAYTVHAQETAGGAAAPLAPLMPELPPLPAFPTKPALAEQTRTSELDRQSERRRRATTLLTGMGGAQVSGQNVTRSLLGQ